MLRLIGLGNRCEVKGGSRITPGCSSVHNKRRKFTGVAAGSTITEQGTRPTLFALRHRGISRVLGAPPTSQTLGNGPKANFGSM